MNCDNYLILVKGEDKTSSVILYRFLKSKPIVYITYNNHKEYPYNISQVQIFKKPTIVQLNNKIVLKHNVTLLNVSQLRIFGNKYCRIIYKNGYSELEKYSNIKIVESALQDEIAKNCFNYLKEIAVHTGLVVDGYNILAKNYEKIEFIRNDSVLSAFLSGKYDNDASTESKHIIYPFGFNLSQKQAVDNALHNKISIIEGPPGTGKTQTILNIIANAIIRKESVAVVSSNNSATENVYEKLKKYGVEFIAAKLGNSNNKKSFIEFQNTDLPDMSDWKVRSDALSNIHKYKTELNNKLKIQNKLSKITAEYNNLVNEYTHFSDYYKTIMFNGDMPIFKKQVSSKEILKFIAEYEFILQNKIKLNFFKKMIFYFSYKLKNLNFFGQKVESITPYCQNIYYQRRLEEIQKMKDQLQTALSVFDFDKKMDNYSSLSMKIFKSNLAKKYKLAHTRKSYSENDLIKNSEPFIKDYPVILSTTYSLRSSLSKNFMYDYVIVDEASQVDLATAALALSCAKKVVIVGDLKQLPNVVTSDKKKLTDDIFKQYKLPEAYRYSDHSLLSSAISLFQNAPRVLLKEHYRCNPEIIGFCNQRFYNNELIILTKNNSNQTPLIVYKTVKGNHARNHINQRQIDVITNEVFPEQNLNPEDNSVGIVTPYRNQANLLQEIFSGTTVKSDTVDKFQGQEKNVIIFSTVDNQIGDFVSDPNRLNVAISRAKDQFIVVTDGNDNDNKSPIYELIGYIKYHNHEIINSEIYSVFDYLYKQYGNERNAILSKYGRIADVDSENLIYSVICDILSKNDYSKYGVVLHVPLRTILKDFSKLNTRELSFATNHLTHVDFLIYSKLTHQPVIVIEVDGFAYHNTEKQKERDQIKDTILQKYNIPIIRLNTTGNSEEQKIISELEKLDI